MKPKRIALTFHLFGRQIFCLSVEWISSDPTEGFELATPLPWGIV